MFPFRTWANILSQIYLSEVWSFITRILLSHFVTQPTNYHVWWMRFYDTEGQNVSCPEDWLGECFVLILAPIYCVLVFVHCLVLWMECCVLETVCSCAQVRSWGGTVAGGPLGLLMAGYCQLPRWQQSPCCRSLLDWQLGFPPIPQQPCSSWPMSHTISSRWSRFLTPTKRPSASFSLDIVSEPLEMLVASSHWQKTKQPSWYWERRYRALCRGNCRHGILIIIWQPFPLVSHKKLGKFGHPPQGPACEGKAGHSGWPPCTPRAPFNSALAAPATSPHFL
jgi:hypothetical protein